MKGLLTTILASFGATFLVIENTVNGLDFYSILDKYGFPTAALIVAVWFIWNRQKKSDAERNELIGHNNDLTQELISAVKLGNACKFIELNKGEKND